MREFERQIQRYQAQLPCVRERLIAAFAALLIAVVTTISSSFAWVVLSTSPEIKGINTTITANGNLEIALASGSTITVPADSEIGDSGKDLLIKNATWGNLINLADAAYGLENIVLRPATLNTNSLLESPLYSAGYGEDGRVEGLESDFAFASWNNTNKLFEAQNVTYGVRTVASVMYMDAAGDTALSKVRQSADEKISLAKSHLRSLGNASQIDNLGTLMQQYVQDMVDSKLGGGAEKVIKIDPVDMQAIYELMEGLRDNAALIADALAEDYNIQLVRNMGAAYYETNPFTGTFLLTASMTDVNAKMAVKNSSGDKAVTPQKSAWLTTLRNAYNGLIKDLAELEGYLGRTDVVWENLDETATNPQLYPIINRVVQISSCTIDGTPLSSISSMSSMLSLLGKSKVKVEVQSGYLKDLDQLSGANFTSKEIALSVKALGMNKNVKGTVTTYASNTKNTEPRMLDAEFNKALSGASNFKGTDPVAKDTFGLALDFFLRTNAHRAGLILQGSPVYDEREETVTGVVDGQTVNLYTVTVGSGDQTATCIAFQKDGKYYVYNEGVAGEEITEYASAVLLTETVRYVVGYAGVNRVWDEEGNAYLDATSTTQGSGSCYVFYASSPDDQEKSLQLLEHMKVAFIDQNGRLLNTATMDTENSFEQVGKVTVPLVLTEGDFVKGEDGEPIYTITTLEQNVPTFITALVYLEGDGLTNDQVLAAGEIQGQLNIQFGTTTNLHAMEDTPLIEEKCVVTAEMEGDTKVNYDLVSASALKKKVTVSVDGYTPNKVEGFFLREVNNSQGVRLEKMTFTKNDSGDWVGEYQFDSPGKYIMREVMLDGITYQFDHEPITFEVEGFAITSIFCADNGKTHMSIAKQYETEVVLTFASSDVRRMPTSVKGAFVHTETGNRTTVYFTYESGSTWKGKALFTTSGEYRMERLELNDNPTGLADSQKIRINLYLGLSTRVYAEGETTFGLPDGEARTIKMSVAIETDDGTRIRDLDNVWLNYKHRTSNLSGNQLSARMQWNSSTLYYEGNFNVSVDGIYDFSYVTVTVGSEDSTLSQAKVAPTITAAASEPPTYLSKNGFGEQFSLGNGAAFTITMRNASSATVDAILKNQDGEIYYSRGKQSAAEGGGQLFTFTMPILDGTQSGTWTLEGVYMTNVMDKNGRWYNASIENGPDMPVEAPTFLVEDWYYNRWWRWTVADLTAEGETTDTTIRLVSKLNVSIDTSATQTQYNGNFGQKYQLSGFNVNVTADDGNNSPLSTYGLSVESIQVTYKYNQRSFGSADANGMIHNTYGNFRISRDKLATLTAGTDVVFKNTAVNGSAYALTTTNAETWLAGLYEDHSIELIIRNGDELIPYAVPDTLMGSLPTYTIRSATPSALITGVTGPDYKTNATFTNEGNCSSGDPIFATSVVSSSEKKGIYNDGTRAVLYPTVTADNNTRRHAIYGQPTLTVTIGNISSDCTASFILPAGASKNGDIEFSRTGNGTIAKALGSASNIKTWPYLVVSTHYLQAYYGHGTQTINQMTVTRNNVAFVVDIGLTVVNPSSDNQV